MTGQNRRTSSRPRADTVFPGSRRSHAGPRYQRRCNFPPRWRAPDQTLADAFTTCTRATVHRGRDGLAGFSSAPMSGAGANYLLSYQAGCNLFVRRLDRRTSGRRRRRRPGPPMGRRPVAVRRRPLDQVPENRRNLANARYPFIMQWKRQCWSLLSSCRWLEGVPQRGCGQSFGLWLF